MKGARYAGGKTCFILLWHLFSDLWCPILTSSDLCFRFLSALKDLCWQQRKPKCSAATGDGKSVSLRLLCRCGSTRSTRSFLQHQETCPFCVWMLKRHCSNRINSWQRYQEATFGVGDVSHCRQLPGPVQDGYGGSPLWSCWAIFPHFPPAFCLAPQLAALPVPHNSSWSYWSL